MTWVVSALWHGLYPGYHMSFIVFALATVTARKVSSYHMYLSYVLYLFIRYVKYFGNDVNIHEGLKYVMIL